MITVEELIGLICEPIVYLHDKYYKLINVIFSYICHFDFMKFLIEKSILTANFFTYARMFLAIPTILFIISKNNNWASFLIICSDISDLLDGTLARIESTLKKKKIDWIPSKKRKSLDENWGMIFDALADKVFVILVSLTIIVVLLYENCNKYNLINNFSAIFCSLLLLAQIISEILAIDARYKHYYLYTDPLKAKISASASGKAKMTMQMLSLFLISKYMNQEMNSLSFQLSVCTMIITNILGYFSFIDKFKNEKIDAIIIPFSKSKNKIDESILSFINYIKEISNAKRIIIALHNCKLESRKHNYYAPNVTPPSQGSSMLLTNEKKNQKEKNVYVN